ncbi:hypothetical protein A2U01_0085528, partial [Trifolium medium]|nr:hypothetical protein [Trifolium medium]
EVSRPNKYGIEIHKQLIRTGHVELEHTWLTLLVRAVHVEVEHVKADLMMQFS